MAAKMMSCDICKQITPNPCSRSGENASLNCKLLATVTKGQTDYQVGQWIGWNGGECPVHPETVVEIVDFDGISDPSLADEWNWNHKKDPIIAFRIVTPYVEPAPKLECWVLRHGDSTDITSDVNLEYIKWLRSEHGGTIHHMVEADE